MIDFVSKMCNENCLLSFNMNNYSKIKIADVNIENFRVHFSAHPYRTLDLRKLICLFC